MARVLMIDNYDSFVYTIVDYLCQLGAEVDVVRNDGEADFSQYDGVVVSPGPGAPVDAKLSLAAITYCEDHQLPLLGVCLGHQAMGEVFGGVVHHCPELMHGKTSTITHDGTGVFEGVPQNVTVARYHSLAIDPDTLPECLRVTARTESGVIMGVTHRSAPIYGVQFHPESVITQYGHLMIANWLEMVGVDGARERGAELAREFLGALEG